MELNGANSGDSIHNYVIPSPNTNVPELDEVSFWKNEWTGQTFGMESFVENSEAALQRLLRPRKPRPKKRGNG